ncbi:MAG TPA: Gfo/Idh/MocA family oxidoreductase [Bacteroidales bacterium]|jgi:predicted dehydrogenase|nr:Gfo/Idh/MocA family oxidoreductase [Bacteroidales bacterium]HQJ81318.1 Gfo/Idh/MocA family oxidoreductase [Bacteroidales bacterium]
MAQLTGMEQEQEDIKQHRSDDRVVKIVLFGAGKRGVKLLHYLLSMDNTEIVAICDRSDDSALRAAAVCTEAGKKKPSVYSGDRQSVAEILDREKPDAVIIATYWDSHAGIALEAMRRNIYPGIDVPAALRTDDLWQLVETSENTGTPCMMLENWSFRKDNLAVLNMKRLGMFGKIVHCHCAHSHNCIDHWFFDSESGEARWQAEYLLKYNRMQYPTHALGPVISWMDINRGDAFSEIYTIASAPLGINEYFRDRFGEHHPEAGRKYRQGDIVTSVLSTKKGKTLVINNDLQLRRPYANRWMLQGTRGVYDEEKGSVYLADFSPEYQKWEPWQPYEEKYNHRWWQTDFPSPSFRGADYIMLRQFTEAVRRKGPVPLDVYDSAVMSATIELSGISAEKKKSVPFPDFTRGKWQTNQEYFAV